jgi:hypothetical protein
MTPDSLRTLSLRTFKATVYCAIAGIVAVIAAPLPNFREVPDPPVLIVVLAGLVLLAIAVIGNLVSLISGAVAWTKGARGCPWIVVSLLLLLIPVGLWVAIRLNP